MGSLNWKNLRTRIISAAILAPLVAGAAFIGGVIFNMLVLITAIIMAFEWNDIVNHEGQKLSQKEQKKWRIAGIAYTSIFASSLFYLMSLHNGNSLMLFIIFVVWATDIAAYFAGSIIGGKKILPQISPKKTWSGLAGGMAAAAIIGALASVTFSENFIVMGLISALLAACSQAGDFLESWIKRRFQVKDSGHIIPGHGGVMDRVDGFTVVAPVLALLALLSGGSLF